MLVPKAKVEAELAGAMEDGIRLSAETALKLANKMVHEGVGPLSGGPQALRLLANMLTGLIEER